MLSPEVMFCHKHDASVETTLFCLYSPCRTSADARIPIHTFAALAHQQRRLHPDHRAAPRRTAGPRDRAPAAQVERHRDARHRGREALRRRARAAPGSAALRLIRSPWSGSSGSASPGPDANRRPRPGQPRRVPPGPRPVRSWRRDETVAERANGSWLSDRDWDAVGAGTAPGH